ncbi:MBL fold metallo-hydrolase [Streptomyces sp. NPDC055632]
MLADPNFLHKGQYAYLGNGLVSRRLRDPVREVEALPQLDAVVLSRLQGEHFDRVVRRGLKSGLPFLTTPHVARRLNMPHGFHQARGLTTWEDEVLGRRNAQVLITAPPARHAGHSVLRRFLPPAMGAPLQSGQVDGPGGVNLYLTGDTLPFEGPNEIPRRFPGIHLTVLHLGGTTLPGGMLVTMHAEQGAELAHSLDTPRIMPAHYEEYTVMKSPLSAFLDAARRKGLGERLVHCPPGVTTTVRVAPHPVP